MRVHVVRPVVLTSVVNGGIFIFEFLQSRNSGLTDFHFFHGLLRSFNLDETWQLHQRAEAARPYATLRWLAASR